MEKYGATIQGTYGNILPAQEWGVITAKDNSHYIHLLNAQKNPFVFIPLAGKKLKKASLYSNGKSVNFKQVPEGVFLYMEGIAFDSIDTIVELSWQ